MNKNNDWATEVVPSTKGVIALPVTAALVTMAAVKEYSNTRNSNSSSSCNNSEFLIRRSYITLLTICTLL